ncbi:MAG: glycerol-3-phosphate 1-O-acyltransferase PlsY [Faecalibacterium sp.]|nr:glycerol-3-phosphate 1-O-acyltransferase PlsY [Faecalibacterium sp.]
MTILLICLAVAAVSYLLGSIMFGVIISNWFYHDDIRTHGSGSAGMTNMLRTFGKKAAVFTAAGDGLKAVASVLFARLLVSMLLGGENQLVAMLIEYLAMAFVMLGHFKPLFFGFKGGKGVITGGFSLLVINPPVVLSMLAVFLVAFCTSRMVSLGSILAASSYPVFTLLYGLVFQKQPLQQVIAATAIALFLGGSVVYMHRSNIKRILSGTEYKFDGSHKKN